MQTPLSPCRLVLKLRERLLIRLNLMTIAWHDAITTFLFLSHQSALFTSVYSACNKYFLPLQLLLSLLSVQFDWI